MSELKVNWGKCEDNGDWCDFKRLNLSHELFEDLKGVYVIWSAGDDVIRVGSGDIKDRVAAHRKDNDITEYPNLLVTWAKVPEDKMEGVEKYLADKYEPKVGERFPKRTPIPVNLPIKAF